MPTYAYACTACDHQFEIQQSFTDDALTECPECDGRVRKLFNAVGIVFKGSGFYRTDSRSSGSGSGTTGGKTTTGADKATSSTATSSGGDSGSSSSSTTSTSGSSGSSTPASTSAA